VIKLQTPFGTYHLMQPARVVGVGALYKGNAKYKEPTRPVDLDTGKTVYILDTEANMRALVGADYVPDARPAAKPKKAKKQIEADEAEEN
jgi:hypothetical protein